MASPTLTPRLVVRSASEAIAFYQRVFGAEVTERYDMPDGRTVHAALTMQGAVISLTDVLDHNRCPDDLGGSSVILSLVVEDPDALAERAVAEGAKIVFPIADQFYGYREGRIEDPFGHLWILSKVTREMTPEEIQAAMDEWASL